MFPPPYFIPGFCLFEHEQILYIHNHHVIIKSITRQAKEILKLNTVQENSNILSYLSFQDSPPFLSEKFLNMRNEQISVVNKNGVHIKLIASCDKDYDSDLIVLTLYKQKNMQALANMGMVRQPTLWEPPLSPGPPVNRP